MKQTLEKWCKTTYRQLKMRESDSDSGSNVDNDVSTTFGKGPSGTFVRPSQEVTIRLNDLFMSRRMELKGWIKHRSAETKDLQTQRLRILSMILTRWHLMSSKKIDWDEIRNEQGTWPTKKYGKLVVQQRDQFSHKNWTIRCHEREAQERFLQTERQSSFIQTWVKSEMEVIDEDPCFILSRSRGGEKRQVQDPRCLWQNSNQLLRGKRNCCKIYSWRRTSDKKRMGYYVVCHRRNLYRIQWTPFLRSSSTRSDARVGFLLREGRKDDVKNF